jgi:NADH:ubiquinone oxidoreductase subunit 5 (subunit L)/multisubunit Na+/H+ antiporter MnhA subunit
MSATTDAWLVLAMPLAGTLIIAFGFKVLPGRSAGWIGTLAIAASFIFALDALIKLQALAPSHRELSSTLWSIANTVGVNANATLLVDPLSVFMICVVAGVSMLIHLYSVSYLSGDEGYARFFAYLNFFVFSMLLLVLAGNFLLLIVGWAFVGAASYLLISFWYRRTTATRAGIKAFVINVVGDVGLVLGTFFIFRTRTRSTSWQRFTPHHTCSRRAAATSPPAACCYWSGRSPSPRRSRCTPGCRTRWRARPPSAPDPRRDDGDRGRLPDRAHAPAVRAGTCRRDRWCDRRRGDAAGRWDDRARRRPTSSA